MCVFIPGSIRPVRFGPAGTDSIEVSVPAATYISLDAGADRKTFRLISINQNKCMQISILFFFVQECFNPGAPAESSLTYDCLYRVVCPNFGHPALTSSFTK